MQDNLSQTQSLLCEGTDPVPQTLNVLQRSRNLRKKYKLERPHNSLKNGISLLQQKSSEVFHNPSIARSSEKTLKRKSWELKQADQVSWASLRGLHPGHHLRIGDIAELRRWFSKLDTNGSGEIDVLELGDPMITTGLVNSEEELVQLFKILDIDKSGEINLSEFIAGLSISKNNRRIGAEKVGQVHKNSTDKTAAIASFLENSGDTLQVSTSIGIERRQFILSALMALKGNQKLEPQTRREQHLRLKTIDLSPEELDFDKIRTKFAAIKNVVFLRSLNTENIVEIYSHEKQHNVQSRSRTRLVKNLVSGKVNEVDKESSKAMRAMKRLEREARSKELRKTKESLIVPKKRSNGVAKKGEKMLNSKVLPTVLPLQTSQENHQRVKSISRAGVEGGRSIIPSHLIHVSETMGKFPVPKFPDLEPTSINEFSAFIVNNVKNVY